MILIVDDDNDFRLLLSEILEKEGYKTISAGNGTDALKYTKKYSPELVLLDIKMPKMDGIEILERIKDFNPDISVIMITAFVNIRDAVKTMKLGAYDYITKPITSNEELIHTIDKALKTKKLSNEVDSLRRRIAEERDSLKGDSPLMKKVFKQISCIAKTNMTVVVQGESGTGKELVARQIHHQSDRCSAPFIALDCGAIPDSLFESELFGYEKGAFTGAYDSKEGKFEQAKKGTIFLDEINNLSDAAQVKLLRVIQERKLQRLGGKKIINIDVRIIVATNSMLCVEMRKGKFRSDLYYRLNEFVIDIPSLRERKDDIMVLCKYFIEKANMEHGKEVTEVSSAAMKKILEYNWPGNIRELRNVLRRATILAENSKIEVTNLPSEIINKGYSNQGEFVSSELLSKELGNGLSLSEITETVLKNAEREVISKVLKETKFNKTEAAKMLQVDRKTLYTKMKMLNI